MTLKTLVKPRIYQAPVVTAVKKALEKRDKVLFVMATGLGKTIVSALIVQEWLESGKRGLFLCHENYILEQVEQEYKDVLVGTPLVYKTFYGEDEKDWDADKADMLFASFQSLNNWRAKWYQAFDPDHFDFLIVDESHHGQAPTFKEVIDYFECKKIGMTATPDRMDLKDIREIFGPEVYTISLEEGIANGWLCNVEYHVLSDGINNLKLRKICKDVLEKGKRVSIKQINETIFIHKRDEEEKRIIDEYTHIKQYMHKRKTLIFCERTTHADNIVQHFVNADVMHSKKTVQHNNRVLKDFRQNQLQYVASVNKFNEGKHVSDVEGGVFLRATDSITVFFQQLGRLLAKTGIKETVIVLDFVANVERLIMVRDMMLRVKKTQEDILKEKGVKLPIDTNSFNVSGEGFDFIFSDEIVDIIKIVDALREGYYPTCREASLAAQKLGITTKEEYRLCYKKDLRLPSSPVYQYGDDFLGWTAFLTGKVYEPAPEGWYTIYRLSQESENVSEVGIGNICQEYRISNPEWFEDFKSGSGVAEFLHPDLVTIVRIKIEERAPAPPGWQTAESLGRQKISSTPTIQSIATSYRSSKPEWFKHFWVTGRLVEFFHPILVKKIKKTAKENRLQVGWSTAVILANELDVSKEKIKKFADNYKESHPKWFKKIQGGKNVESYSPELTEIIRKECVEVPVAPKGWISIDDFVSQHPISHPFFLEFIKPYRETHPQWFIIAKKKTNGQKEWYHSRLIAKVEKYIEKHRSDHIPEDWVSLYALKKEIDLPNTMISPFLSDLKKTYPSSFNTFWNGSLRAACCDGFIAQKARTYFKRYKNPLAGWMMVQQIKKLHNHLKPNTVSHQVRLLKNENPKWAKKFRVPQESRIDEYYSPLLIKKVAERLENRSSESAPEGWKTYDMLDNDKRLGVGRTKLMGFINGFRATNPEWYKVYPSVKNFPTEHFHPTLVEMVRREFFQNYKNIPKGWKTASTIAREAVKQMPGRKSIGYDTVKKYAEQYRKTNPNWFKQFITQGGLADHYSTALIKKVNEKLGQHSPAPEGWKSMNSVALSIKVKKKKLQKFTEQFRQSNPEWFAIYFSGTCSTEHYHPELIQKIREHTFIKKR